MSKAALIIDMPEACVDCPFCKEIVRSFEACCELTDEPDDCTFYRRIDSEYGYCQQKPIWCPLKKVPMEE